MKKRVRDSESEMAEICDGSTSRYSDVPLSFPFVALKPPSHSLTTSLSPYLLVQTTCHTIANGTEGRTGRDLVTVVSHEDEKTKMMATCMVKESAGNTHMEFACNGRRNPSFRCSSMLCFQDYDTNDYSSYDQRHPARDANRNYDSKNSYGHDYDQHHGTDEYHQDRDGNGGTFPSRKRHVASEPSPHVIFLGLEPDFTEADVSGTH